MFDFEDQPASMMPESIQELEELGWRAFWIPERDGREAITHAGSCCPAEATRS